MTLKEVSSTKDTPMISVMISFGAELKVDMDMVGSKEETIIQ
jgi:hypothetical protein